MNKPISSRSLASALRLTFLIVTAMALSLFAGGGTSTSISTPIKKRRAIIRKLIELLKVNKNLMFGNGTTLISLRDFGGTKNNNGMMLMVTFTGWSNEAFAMDLLEAVGAATKQEFLDALKWVSGDQYWDRGGGLSANFSTDENLWLEK